MYYCFEWNEIKSIDEKDPLYLQAVFADSMNRSVYFDSKLKVMREADGTIAEIEPGGRRIFARTSYDLMPEVAHLEKMGFEVVENTEDIGKITGWNRYCIAKRKIQCITAEDLIRKRFDDEMAALLGSEERVFLKSERKLFSVVCNTESITGSQEGLAEKLKRLNAEDHILISKAFGIKSDSIGRIEARFFVFDNKIMNCSRYTCTLKHSVPGILRAFAADMADRISLTGLPSNYFMDLGIFVNDDGEEFTDIVELNPVTASMCYINNSIFFEGREDVERVRERYGFGYEYANDFLRHSDGYALERFAGRDYLCCQT